MGDFTFAFDQIPINDLASTSHQAVLDHWYRKRGDAFVPSYRKFAIDELPPHLIPQCMVIDCATDYRFRFYGTYIVSIHRNDFTGTRLMDMVPRVSGAAITDYVDVVRAARRPVAFNAQLLTSHERITGIVSLCVPFSDDGKNVTAVLERLLDGPELETYRHFANNGYSAEPTVQYSISG